MGRPIGVGKSVSKFTPRALKTVAWMSAMSVAVGLAQIGEFSFILSELARRHRVLPDAGHNVLVAAAIISITINPLIFRMLPAIENWSRRRPWLWKLLNGRAERRVTNRNLETEESIRRQVESGSRHAIVVGFGPVGRSVHQLLRDAGLETVVLDLNMDSVSEVSAQGLPAIFGDATHESILEQAGMRNASHLVLTLPHSAARLAVVTAARNLNTTARILVRAHYLREKEDLENAGASAAVFEEAEVAVALARLVMTDTGTRREVVEQKVRDLRLQLITENMSKILEDAADQIEHQSPQNHEVLLSDALAEGGIVLELSSSAPEAVIRELAAVIPDDHIPAGVDIAALAINREEELSSDLGVGVAIPHARCRQLTKPLLVLGRSVQGFQFSPQSPELVRLVFLLMTPFERPDLQLSLLSQLARLAGDPSTRERLIQATTESEITDVLQQNKLMRHSSRSDGSDGSDGLD